MLKFFGAERRATQDVYPSEWLFLKDMLREGVSILDLGCAQGGFASIVAENIQAFSYTGVDISPAMIARAKKLHPQHEFLCVPEGNYSMLKARRFDVVLALGFLHLHLGWRDTLAAAWSYTAGSLLIDLRETHQATLEDPKASRFRMNFDGNDAAANHVFLPYIIVNTSEALETVSRICGGARSIARYGYLHPVSNLADSPIHQTMATTYRIDR